MNVVIYARYSSDSQKDESIDGQVRVCRAYAEAHGMTVVGVYPDPAKTGTNADRPKFQEMIKDAEKGLFESVIVWKLDRFSRDRYDAAMYKHRLKKCGVRVISATESIPDDPTGIILESLMEGMAEYYSANLSQNVKRGNYDSVMNGSALGHQCFGYDIGKDHCYHVNDVEAETVKRIFREYSERKSTKDIIADLNRDGIRNKKGNKFSHNSITRIIGNEKYKGIYRYYDTIVPIEKIVSDEIWEVANEIMNQHKHAPAANAEYLLSGKLFCGECGSGYIGMSGKSHMGDIYYYYACKGRTRDKKCDMPFIGKTEIENKVIEAVVKCLNNAEWVDQVAKDCVAYQDRNQNPELEALRSRRKTAETALTNLVAALEFTADPAVLDRISQRRTEIAELDTAILKCEKGNPKITAEQIKAFFCLLSEGEIDDPVYCRRLVDTFVNKIVIYKNKPPVLILNTIGQKAKCELKDIPDGSTFNPPGVPIVLNTNLFMIFI